MEFALGCARKGAAFVSSKLVQAHRQHAAHGSLFSAAHWATGQRLEGFSWRSHSKSEAGGGVGGGAARWLGGGRGPGTAQ